MEKGQVLSLCPRRGRHVRVIVIGHFFTVDPRNKKGVVFRAFLSCAVPPATLHFRWLELVLQNGLH